MPDIPPNPHLPWAPDSLRANHSRQWRSEEGPRFYLACLEYGQSLWLQEKPAQALLQLNKAFLADLEGGRVPFPLPYPALCWFLDRAVGSDPAASAFFGNPVRHFQHLATRMSGPRAELRSWRAWACYHLAAKRLPADRFPPDLLQREKESITVPDFSEVLKNLPEKDIEALSGMLKSWSMAF